MGSNDRAGKQWHDDDGGGVTAASQAFPGTYEEFRKSASPGGRVPRLEPNDLLLLVSHRYLPRTGPGPVLESGAQRRFFSFFAMGTVAANLYCNTGTLAGCCSTAFSLGTCNTCNTWVNSFRM